MRAIDISSNNHAQGVTLNFAEVKTEGYDAVYVKATQGNNYLNPYLIGDVRDAANNGLLVGVYHFYDAHNGTPQEQAEWFLKNGIMQPEEAGRTVDFYCRLKPVLDYETLSTAQERDEFLATLALPCAMYTDRSIESAIGYGSASFGWLAYPGWTTEQLPSDTAIVQTGQQVVQGIPTQCDVNTVLNDTIILKVPPAPVPVPTEKDTDMIESVLVSVNGVEKLVTTLIVPGNQHVIQMTQNVNELGLAANGHNTQIIDITDAFPPQVPA